jgi:hypothetical protein
MTPLASDRTRIPPSGSAALPALPITALILPFPESCRHYQKREYFITLQPVNQQDGQSVTLFLSASDQQPPTALFAVRRTHCRRVPK